jgi:hypothetical protein
MHLLQVAVLRESAVKVLEKSVKVCLQLCFGNILAVVCGIAVDVGEEDRLREGRLDVFSGTSVAVSTCADLEGAIVRQSPDR